MPKFNAREKVILSVLFAALGLFAVDQWIVSPLMESWRRLDQEIAKKQAELYHDKELLAEKDQLKKEFAAYAGWRPENSARRRAGSMTSLLREIESTAQKSGLKISDIKPQSAQSRLSNGESVFISAQSSWEPLACFCYELQRSPRWLEIQKADIHRQGDNGMLLIGQFVISATASK